MNSGRPMADTVVMVTGANQTSGIGMAIVRRLLVDGAIVLAADIVGLEDNPGMQEEHDRLHYHQLDVTNEHQWATAVARAEALGGLHGLVNNAGYYRPAPLADTSVEEFARHTAINQLGPFIGMKLAAEAMAPRKAGSIVNISSIAGLRGSQRAFAYSGTKWALRGMTKSAALNLAKFGIRVNSVHPGQIETDMIAVFSDQEREERRRAIPLQRSGKPEEVADLVAYLLSNASGFLTGAEIAIDGGFSL